jgi:hypothetical protein
MESRGKLGGREKGWKRVVWLVEREREREREKIVSLSK